MRLDVAHDFLPKTPTLRTSAVMCHFGIDFEQGRHVVAEGLELDLRAAEVAAFTGPSGSGKSSLMRAAAAKLREAGEAMVNLDAVDLGARPLVDSLPGGVEDAMRLLSRCGLGEAHLMLRTPAELSEGQRYRFRLALALSRLPEAVGGGAPQGWVVADEFAAALDRTLARVIAGGLRKFGVGFLIATTHEDVVGDLDPHVWVRCDLASSPRIIRGDGDGGKAATGPGIVTGGEPSGVKKKCPTSSGSVRPPSPIGRTSLGGITEATKWGCCDS